MFFLNPDLLHDFAFSCEADTQERDRFDLKNWLFVATHQINILELTKNSSKMSYRESEDRGVLIEFLFSSVPTKLNKFIFLSFFSQRESEYRRLAVAGKRTYATTGAYGATRCFLRIFFVPNKCGYFKKFVSGPLRLVQKQGGSQRHRGLLRGRRKKEQALSLDSDSVPYDGLKYNA